jgi:hypothetical protein
MRDDVLNDTSRPRKLDEMSATIFWREPGDLPFRRTRGTLRKRQETIDVL